MAIHPEDVTVEVIKRLRDDALGHVRSLTPKMRLVTKADDPLAVEVDIDTNPKDRFRFYNAYAGKVDQHRYRIRIGAGLLLQFDVFAQAMVADETVLKGMRSARFLTDAARALGKARLLHDFFFHFMVSAVFWHELAHIVLGHLDWLGAQGSEQALFELPMAASHEDVRGASQSLEYDADRQASKWLLAVVDLALSNNPSLRYAEDADRFYDFGFLIGFIFRALDALESKIPDCKRVHPDNNVRTLASLHYLDTYFDQYRSSRKVEYRIACLEGAKAALQSVLHDQIRLPDQAEIILNCARADMTIETLGVRAHQLKLVNDKTTFSVGKILE
ncbi:hypothetical protein R75461_03630 [Paraburkholderia nemoris]|nr:hypothetical protein R69619_01964 [Paraburkholderia nemoris]CAE6766401.1 hypothetical protein R75461_03630 [Paraburkholderia nemoris]